MESHTVLSRYVYKKQLMLCIGVLALFVFGLWMAGNEALTNEMPMHLRINGIPFELSTQRATEFYWFITIFCAGLSFLLIALLIKIYFPPQSWGYAQTEFFSNAMALRIR